MVDNEIKTQIASKMQVMFKELNKKKDEAVGFDYSKVHSLPKTLVKAGSTVLPPVEPLKPKPSASLTQQVSDQNQ